MKKKTVSTGDIPIDENGYIIGPSVPVRYRQDFTTTTPDQDYGGVTGADSECGEV